MRVKVDALLRLVEARGAPKLQPIHGLNSNKSPTPLPKSNVIAYSGGVDSTLAAKIVHQVFPETTVACLGISPSLSQQQLQQARDVAEHINMPLWMCHTTESQNEHYVANQGQRCVRMTSKYYYCSAMVLILLILLILKYQALVVCSCYYCKTNLYTTINEVAEFAMFVFLYYCLCNPRDMA